MPRAAGLRKRLRDTIHRVDSDVITAGEHAGSAESPVVYPDPTSPAFEVDGASGIAFATLPARIEFKLAPGIWGRRFRGLAGVESLIAANGRDESLAARLPEPFREPFRERVRGARGARDLE